jgi:hypothetical protein
VHGDWRQFWPARDLRLRPGECGGVRQPDLVFHRTPELAIQIGSIVEEAAQAGVNSSGLGGPAEIPDDLKAAALQRVMAFDQRGTVRA